MKKSIIVNISGIVFHIDEDAYEALNAYIGELNNYFSVQTGGKEIVEDIETRIVELLQPKLTGSKQSISIEDIEEIITVLGKPKDIAGSDEQPTSNGATEKTVQYDESATRKLYRDMDNAYMGGVAAGMGAYFNIDPVIFRLLFFALVFAGGLGIVLYAILWISVPVASTVSQRLEMKGENVNIDNIERKIKEEKLNDSQNFGGNRFAGFINQLMVAFGKFIIVAAKTLKYVFAAFLILVAIGIIIGTITALFVSDITISNSMVTNIGSIQEFLNYFILPVHTDILIMFGLAIILLPCIGFIYWGLKIFIHFKANDKWLSASLSVIWILCIIVFITILLTEVRRFRTESSNTEVVSLQAPSNNKLYLRLVNNERLLNSFYDDDMQFCLFGVEKNGSKNKIYSQIKIRIIKTQNLQPEMEIIRWANSSDYVEANDVCKKIKINVNQNDTILTIDPLFYIEDADKWHFQRCKIILHIPQNYDINMDKGFYEYTRGYMYNYKKEDYKSW